MIELVLIHFACGMYAWCVVTYLDNGYSSRRCLRNWRWWVGALEFLILCLIGGVLIAALVTAALIQTYWRAK